MQGFRRASGMMGLISVVVLVAMAATTPAYGQQCNVKELMPCLSSVKGSYPPQPDYNCCSAVMEANPTCLCSEFVNSNLSPNVIKNVLAIPKACGRTQLSGFHCGIYIIE